MRNTIRLVTVCAAVLAAGFVFSVFRAEDSAASGKKLKSFQIQNKGDFLLLNKREKKKLRVNVRPKSDRRAHV